MDSSVMEDQYDRFLSANDVSGGMVGSAGSAKCFLCTEEDRKGFYLLCASKDNNAICCLE